MDWIDVEDEAPEESGRYLVIEEFIFKDKPDEPHVKVHIDNYDIEKGWTYEWLGYTHPAYVSTGKVLYFTELPDIPIELILTGRKELKES